MAHYDSRNYWWASFCAVAVVFFLVNYKLITMECIFRWDAWNQYWPWFHHLVSSINQGRLPLWTPLPCCGFPFFAEPQTGTFYPVLVLAGLVFGGGYEVYQWYWVLHWFWGTAGFFLLCKRLGLSPIGVFVGCMAFSFSGFFIGNAQHTNDIVTMSFFPWILLVLDYAHEKSISYSVLAGVLLGVSGLGGNPTMTVYASVMLAIWCPLQYRSPLRNLGVIFITLVVAAIIVSPSYISFFVEFGGYTDRTGYLSLWEACDTNRLTLDTLISLVTPALTVAYPHRFGTSEPSMNNLYMGVFALISLVATISDQKLRRRWAWLLIFMLIAFLLSLGTRGGLRVIGYYLLPPLRMVRHSALFRAFFLLGGAIIAGSVADRLAFALDEDRNRTTLIALKVLLVMLLMAMASLVWAWLVPEFHAILVHNGVLLGPNSGALALRSVQPKIVLLLLFLLGILLLRKGVLGRLFVAFLLVMVVADAALHMHTNRSTVCWNGKAVQLAEKLQQTKHEGVQQTELARRNRRTQPIAINLWAFDGQFYIRAYLASRSRDFEFLVGGTRPPVVGTNFIEVLAKSPTFWLTPTVAFTGLMDKAALMRIRSAGPDSAVPVFVHCERPKGPVSTGMGVVPGSYGKVHIQTYDPDTIVLLVEAPRDCWLFATQRYAPSWRAYVDGRETEVHKANFCFRAISVPRGNHVVHFQYKPVVYRPLLWISWSLIVIVIAYHSVSGLISIFRRRKVE